MKTSKEFLKEFSPASYNQLERMLMRGVICAAMDAYKKHILDEINISQAAVEPQKLKAVEEVSANGDPVDFYFDLTLLVKTDNSFQVIDNSQKDWKEFVDCSTLAVKTFKVPIG